MSHPRPAVINFNPDAPIECQKAMPPIPAPPRVSTKVPVVCQTEVGAAKLLMSQDVSCKPWKNIAITEYDDAEFEELQAGLVFTWPPTHRRDAEEERASGEATERADENSVPEGFYGTSLIGSASTEGSSMILTPTQRDYDVHDAIVESEAKAGPLKKVVGLQRLRRKAPPPLSLNSKKKHVDGMECTLRCVSLILRFKQMLSPLTAVMNITSKLSAGILSNIYTFSDELLFR